MSTSDIQLDECAFDSPVQLAPARGRAGRVQGAGRVPSGRQVDEVRTGGNRGHDRPAPPTRDHTVALEGADMVVAHGEMGEGALWNLGLEVESRIGPAQGLPTGQGPVGGDSAHPRSVPTATCVKVPSAARASPQAPQQLMAPDASRPQAMP